MFLNAYCDFKVDIYLEYKIQQQFPYDFAM